MMKLLVLVMILFVSLFVSNAFSEEIVFEGVPNMTSTASPEESFNLEVKGEDQINYRCIIAKEDNSYIWFSRDKRKLSHIKSGAFDYFIEPNGAGYIKITRLNNGKYMYMESLSMLFKVITYWGMGEKFDP